MGNSCLSARLLAHGESVLSKATEFQVVGVREVEGCFGNVDHERHKGWIRSTLRLAQGGLPACGKSPTEDGETRLETRTPHGFSRIHRGNTCSMSVPTHSSTGHRSTVLGLSSLAAPSLG